MDGSLIKPESGSEPSSSRTQTTSSNNNRDESCKYKGVRKRKWGKWVCEIRLPNSRERIWLGSYDSPEKAARAFDAAQVCLRGTLANLNFPDNPPNIPGGQSMTPSEIQAVASSYAELDDGQDDLGMDRVDPFVSDAGVQMDNSFSEVAGVEASSFQEELSLYSTLGSGNYVSEFGYFTGYDSMMGDFQHVSSQTNSYDYMEEDTYDNSLYQDNRLWNF